ncbi:DNA helicase RecQ [Mesonia oceanica]|uniref:ATP-dependent DNA helicase RecQ n=1 Tax=Mesonia oceanica TaxID=2687242 RepID=A0AC61Y489_9FLAO|nr:DNA helicase RecQ [Mesonia oceanica]MAQ42461.1 DNA helicase RecQ [Mesonia sp.]MBJ96765.1 DNA helicase RecQ [Flavobacteriaceae bacterium]VVU99255.1 ATP-dependent DNA helicase RecQ [Mesonia oceanica]|tara:strand:- start:24287 stop:26395 length:2109 start_codon:yes stop_codon:yes gene_type:complete
MAEAILKEHLYPTLKKYFGYDEFRPKQEAIISNVLAKKDTLVIMPTGGGKSICYQLPALLLEGVTLVISPLIALMKDQVDGLKANGVEADFFNSSQEPEEQQEIFEKVAQGTLKLLYVAPESLSALNDILKETYISCIAIDEAHCISSWGHDFRPSYQQLGFLKRSLPNTPIIALTATADKATRQDIVEQLNIPHAQQFISSFDRANIKLEVRPAENRVAQIIRFIEKRPDESGIIYCLSRKGTENLAEKLQQKGIEASAYHAGLSHEDRSQVQEDFIFDKKKIVCATVAFGMGIDKSNVRFVIHYNMPKNIEGYYQEIGRAGRDGLPSFALLFHTYADVIQLRRFTEGASNEDLQNAKLERMKEFAEATDCRRKILLSYFGEYLEENCGNCDVCENPPKFFDGTVIAQKLLSCIARLKGTEPSGVVIDVLRGAQNQNILGKNLQQLKTYGIGSDIAWRDWQHYLTQLINQGYCEIAFHQQNALHLTQLAKKVLFEKQQVWLTRPQSVQEKKETARKTTPKKASGNSLFERLRKLRYEIAQEEDIPAYLVFNDATLKEIERERPQTDEEFKRISGVGERKLEVYGDVFMNEIRKFHKKKRKKANTHLTTYELYQQGLSVEEISKKRELAVTTIYSHIAKLYMDGKDINIHDFVSQQEIEQVQQAQQELQHPEGLKPYFEHFQEQLPYFKIRLALSVMEKEKK